MRSYLFGKNICIVINVRFNCACFICMLFMMEYSDMVFFKFLYFFGCVWDFNCFIVIIRVYSIIGCYIFELNYVSFFIGMEESIFFILIFISFIIGG